MVVEASLDNPQWGVRGVGWKVKKRYDGCTEYEEEYKTATLGERVGWYGTLTLAAVLGKATKKDDAGDAGFWVDNARTPRRFFLSDELRKRGEEKVAHMKKPGTTSYATSESEDESQGGSESDGEELSDAASDSDDEGLLG